MNKPTPSFQFDNSYARALEGVYVEWVADKAPSGSCVSEPCSGA